MEHQILKMINMACRSEDCYFGDDLNLGELHQRTDETGPLADRFTAALQSALDAAPPGNETLQAALFEMDNVGGELCSSYEEQGFVNGFLFAVKLMQECSPAGQKGA